MHYKPCGEIIGGARALLPMEDYASDFGSVVPQWESALLVFGV